MKKTFSVILLMLLVISLILGSFSASFAQENNGYNKPGKTQIVINEYLKLKELKNKDDSKLRKLGYTDEAINQIRNIDYAAELQRRSQLDGIHLKNLGYSDKQIEMLRIFSGTESEIIALAATLTLNAQNLYYYYSPSSNRTYFGVSFDWNWSSLPAFLQTDIVGIGWSEEFYLRDITDASHFVRYRDYTYGYYSQEQTSIIENSPTGTISTTFPMVQSTNETTFWWAEQGYGSIEISKAGQHPEAAVRVAYGHSSTTATPSVAYPWGVGFTFSNNVTEMDYARIYASL